MFERSYAEPVVLFLDAPSCPIGRFAHGEMEQLGEPAEVINVERQRDLTAAVEGRTGVRHESPQVLLLRGGEAVWVGSHWDITRGSVAAALESSRGTA